MPDDQDRVVGVPRRDAAQRACAPLGRHRRLLRPGDGDALGVGAEPGDDVLVELRERAALGDAERDLAQVASTSISGR